MTDALLEVAVRHARDVPGCAEGGADRLSLQVGDDDAGSSPDLAAAASVIRSTDLPVRVVLRLGGSFTTNGGEMVRLVGLAEEYVGLGAEGVCFGFLDPDLEIDEETCATLAGSLPGVPWTFHRGFDAALDAGRSWRRVRRLPGLTAVCSGGSTAGLARGYDELIARAEADPEIARLLMPGGGLAARAGAVVRPGRCASVPRGRAGAPRRHPEVVRRRRVRALVAADARRARWPGARGPRA